MRIPSVVNRQDAPIVSADAYAAVSPSSVVINTNGAFVRSVAAGNATLPRFGGYSPGSLESRVLQLLHEAGHLTITDVPSASYIYTNGRHLVNEIHYSAPGGITPTSNVTFAYDAAGNRTSMNDGLGSQSYNYNQLSQMTSESRYFSALGQSYNLSYDYNLAGQLKRITDSTNMTINYGLDSSGRLNAVTGTDNLFMGITNYASNFQYRAWGGLKAMTSGDNRTTSVLYNPKLQPTNFAVNGLVNQNYSYHNDGRVSFVQNTTDANFDRSFAFDHADAGEVGRPGAR